MKVCCTRQASLLLQASEVRLLVLLAGSWCFCCFFDFTFYILTCKIKNIRDKYVKKERYSCMTRVIILCTLLCCNYNRLNLKKTTARKCRFLRGNNHGMSSVNFIPYFLINSCMLLIDIVFWFGVCVRTCENIFIKALFWFKKLKLSYQ